METLTPVRPLTKSVRVDNPNPFPFDGSVTRTIPFAEGEYHGAPLSASGEAVQAVPFGAKWPDGSWRHVLATFRATVPARDVEEVFLDTSAAIGARPFTWTTAIKRAAPNLLFGIRCGGEIVAFHPSQYETIDAGPLLFAWRCRLRVPNTPLWAELTIELGSGGDGLLFWLHFGDSLTADPELVHRIGQVELVVSEGTISVFDSDLKVLGRRRSGPGRLESVILSGADRWGDGESLHVAGYVDLGPSRRSAVQSIAAISQDWPDSGAWGPFGEAPPNARQTLGRPTHTWDEPFLGCDFHPGRPADQRDFARAVLCYAAKSGDPTDLEVAAASVRQEACRPTWIRNVDGSPFRFSRMGPGFHMWNGIVFHATSANRLGKNKVSGEHRTVHGFHGHDRQHYSINYLCFWTLATGDRWGRAACDHHAELWIASMATDSGNAVIDGIGAARAIGRTLQTASLLYLVTGREDLAAAMRARIRLIARKWAGRNGGLVRPLVVNPADPRYFDGEGPYWSPWQEAMGAAGLRQAGIVLDDDVSTDLAYLVAKNVVLHGLREREGGVLGCEYGVRWHGPARVGRYQAPAGGYWTDDWAWTAVKFAGEWARIFEGDPDVSNRATKFDDRQTRRAAGNGRRIEWGIA